MPYVYRSFSAKEPYNECSFAENDLRLKASYGSSPPCTISLVLTCENVSFLGTRAIALVRTGPHKCNRICARGHSQTE